MRVRRPFSTVVVACTAIGALIAGCGTSSAPPGQTTGGQGGPATGSSAGIPASTVSGVSGVTEAPNGASAPVGGSASGGQSAPSTASSPQGNRITVVQPSGTVPSTSSPPVVTTTVTVTPTRTKKSHPTGHSGTTHSTSTATSSTKRTLVRTTHSASTKPSAPPTTSTKSIPATSRPAGHGPLAGTVVVIDPGHNGANHLHPEIINKQVPAGFGQYKNCNTTGTETNAGYPEYRFNWQVALALRDALRAKGITVVMTRHSDDGVGPCVNERAAIGNDAHADAVVSIHGDGESAGIRGFYVMTASRAPAGQAMADRSLSLARAIRDGLSGANFPVSNALGQNGLWTRSDLAGLNLSLRPTVMIECGNMRNATEAALMSSSDGQQRYAAGIAAGVVAFLGG